MFHMKPWKALLSKQFHLPVAWNLTIWREGKPVTEYRDGTKISFANGIKMLKKYKEHEAETSIFDEFDFMDSREEGLRY